MNLGFQPQSRAGSRASRVPSDSVFAPRVWVLVGRLGRPSPRCSGARVLVTAQQSSLCYTSQTVTGVWGVAEAWGPAQATPALSHLLTQRILQLNFLLLLEHACVLNPSLSVSLFLHFFLLSLNVVADLGLCLVFALGAV